MSEFFAPRHKTRAYYAFSISKQLGETVKYMTPILISWTGWRMAWMIGGGFGIIIGVLLIITVQEPHQQKQIVLTKDKSVAKEIFKEADEHLKQSGQRDFEVT